MSAELTFDERFAVKLQVGAMAAIREFLEARGVRPTHAQIQAIAAEVTPRIIAVTRGSEAATDEELTEIVRRATAIAIETAARVCGLVKLPAEPKAKA